jgi:SPP1 gp7 family putative phage head morphogenesis protein
VLLEAIDHDREQIRAVRAKLHKSAGKFFSALRETVVSRVRGAAHKLAKGMGEEDDKDWPIAGTDWSPLQDAIRHAAEEAAKDGAAEALDQVGADDLDAMLHQANERAVSWAEQRAAESVTQIDETTREKIRDAIKAGIEDGQSMDQVAEALQESFWLSDSRAETIARTETAEADIEGNKAGWKVSGVVAGKEWITSKTDPCSDCAALDGQVVPLDQEFPEGDPPLHPRCECDLLPVLAEDDGEED